MRTRRGLILSLAAAGAFALPTAGAYALWNISATATVAITTAAPPSTLTPATPFCSTANSTNGKLSITWTAVTGASGYHLYRSNGTGAGSLALYAPTTGVITDTSFEVPSSALPENGKERYFTVRSVNSSGKESGGDSALVKMTYVKTTNTMTCAVVAG